MRSQCGGGGGDGYAPALPAAAIGSTLRWPRWRARSLQEEFADHLQEPTGSGAVAQGPLVVGGQSGMRLIQDAVFR